VTKSIDYESKTAPAGRRGVPKVAQNVVWNWAGMGVQMLTGVIIAPFLIRQLGDSVYGLWILIGSLTGYFGLLDLGVRGSVGRYIAFYRAQKDPEGVNGILNTALAALCIVAGAAALMTLVFVWLFPHMFVIPADQVQPARIALLIVGINLAVTFPVAIFDSVLWALQRFDLINIVDIPLGILRTLAAYYFVKHGHGLIALAVIAIANTALAAVIKAIMSFRVEPILKLGTKFIRRGAAGQLYSFGIWSFLLAAAREGRDKLSPVLIGAMLSVQLVTIFSIASRLIGYATQFVIASTGVLTPLSTTLHAQDKTEQQQRLFLEGGKYCTAIALYFLLLFYFLGHTFVRLWVGPHLEGAAFLLNILVIGEVIPMSQWVTYSMILGMAKHKLSAWVAVLETALMVGLMVGFVRPWGLVGVCLAIAVAGTVCRGVFQIVYGCHLTKVRLSSYFAQALARPLILAIVAAAAMRLVTAWRLPMSWLALLGYTMVFSLCYFGIAIVFLGGYEHMRVYREPIVDAVPEM
jgi:O-antigen/teichoic acid export membrane protein